MAVYENENESERVYECCIFKNSSTRGFYLELHALTLAMHPFLCALGNRNRGFRYGVVPLLTELISNAGKIDKLPYSAKFSRDKIFADRPFANFRGNKFRGSKIPADDTYLRTLRVPIYQEIVFRSSAQLQQRHVQLLVSLFQLFALV